MLHSDLGGCIVKWDNRFLSSLSAVDGQPSLYLMENLVSPDHCFGDRLVLPN